MTATSRTALGPAAMLLLAAGASALAAPPAK